MTDRTQSGAGPRDVASRDGAASAATPFGARRWSRRLAWATLLVGLPLFFFGGTVTTLHAGLAIDGWLVLEPGKGDWFLWAYPVEQWFRDVGTFVEHSHRLLGSAVGLLAIATVIAAFVADRRGTSFKVASVALACVIAQGVLGGMRVLEKSETLAFVHGAVAQLTVALLCASVVVSSPAWFGAADMSVQDRRRTSKLPLVTVLAVYSEIVVGAWLRHGGATPALFLHVLLVIAVVLCVLLEARQLRARSANLGTPGVLRSLRLGLLSALTLQVALGLLAFLSVYVVVGKNPGSVSQSLFPTLHVMGGAALFSTSVAVLVWSFKNPRSLDASAPARVASRSIAQAELGGAR
jgi:cytochrome c oxidase assembly protein subunit 15